MRYVTYAGETVITSDDVAEALVTLTAAVAAVGEADAVRIPIVDKISGATANADLVIGVGNDVLSAPAPWEGDEPDFSAGARELRSHEHYPRVATPENVTDISEAQSAAWDPDVDGITHS